MAGNNIMNIADMNINGMKKNKPDVRHLMEMLMGFQKSQIIFTATSFGIFDELSRSAQPLTASQVATKLQLDCDATERLLNSCVTLGLVTANKDNDAVTYDCCPVASMCLTKSSRGSMRPLVQSVGDMYKLWGQLPEIIKDGQSEVCQFNGSYFENGEGYYKTENKQLEFLHTMHIFCKQDAPHIFKHIDLSAYSNACDLGGGTGTIAREMASRFPSLQVSVLELPHVVKVAQNFPDNNSSGSVKFIAGDMFCDALPPADLFILSHVIHDWATHKIDILLSKIYKTLPKGGGLLILEKLLNDIKTGPVCAVMQDLNMLVGCEGRERSADEYKSLLSRSGFNSVHTIPVPAAMHRDIIFARKM